MSVIHTECARRCKRKDMYDMWFYWDCVFKCIEEEAKKSRAGG